MLPNDTIVKRIIWRNRNRATEQMSSKDNNLPGANIEWEIPELAAKSDARGEREGHS